VILDSNFKPWLLEVNHSPSFSTDSDLDLEIKTAVISEALALVNLNEKKKKEILAETKKMNRHRSLSSRSIKPSKEEKMVKVGEEVRKRNLFEDQHCKGFIKLYPGSNDHYYDNFFKTAECFYYKLSTPKRPSSGFRIQEDEDADRKVENFSHLSNMLAKRRAAWS
jgi:tubulin polyglutamylase TTLL6/13